MFKLLVFLAIVAFAAAETKPAIWTAPVASYYSNVGTPAATVKTGHVVAPITAYSAPLTYGVHHPYSYGYASPYYYNAHPYIF